jgi:CAAX protease family protein
VTDTRPPPPAGWYADPDEEHAIRWWDGTAWSEHRARPTGRPVRSRLVKDAAPLGAEAPVRPLVALAMAVVPLLITIAAIWLLTASGVSWLWAFVLGAFVLQPLLMLIGPLLHAGHHGLSLVDLVSLRFRWRDIPRGLGMGLVALSVGLPVRALLELVSKDLLGSNIDVSGNGSVERGDLLVPLLVLGLAIVVVAPLLEEITFRGVLLPSLSHAWGPTAGWIVSSVVFGAMHFSPGLGLGNVGLVAQLSTAGAVLGYEARRSGRLGPSIVAHATNNLVAYGVILLLVLGDFA